MAAVTRLGLHGGPRGLYGDFSAKTSIIQMSGTTGFAWTPTGALDVEATLAGSTGFTFTPTGSLDQEATLAGSTGFTWTPTGNLTEPGTAASPTGGGWVAQHFYDHYTKERRDRRAERDKVKVQVESIEDKTDAEIARLLHKQMEQDARRAELESLEALVKSTYTERQAGLALEYNERVAKAYVRAATQANFSAMEAFEREMDRAREEEEFLFLAMTVLQ